MNTDMPLCLAVADIHGNTTQYEKIKKLVRERQVEYVFMCGDLLPKTGGKWTLDNKVRTIAMQADFIKSYFIDYLTELGAITNVYAIFGNDDFKSNYDMLKDADISNVHFLDQEVVPFRDEMFIAGYPYVGLTPFLHKDWERWDTKPGEISHKIYKEKGYVSQEGEHIPIDFMRETKTLSEDLKALAKKGDPRKTIYMFHEAPFDTPLDMIAPDNPFIREGELHIGSVAMRDFIEKQQPLITMHGHIHETLHESGDYAWRHGNSVSITPSHDFKSDRLACVFFSANEPFATVCRELV